MQSEAEISRADIDQGEQDSEEGVDDKEEDGVMAADQAHEGKPLELLVPDEALDAVDQEVVVQDEEDRKEVQ